METIFNEIAREIKGHTNRTVNKAISSLEFNFGTITSTGLKIDDFKHEIKDYMILDYLKLDDKYETENAGKYTHNHVLKVPDKLKKIAPGNRVLVAIVRNDFVVIGRITNA